MLFTGLDILDGDGLRPDMALALQGGHVAEVAPRGDRTGVDLSDKGARAVITPGLIDLQVNGGAGLMVADCTTSGQILDIADAHWATGTASILPTLISDTPAATRNAIQQVADAQQAEPSTIIGMHLEGPHIAIPGAHDRRHLRPMTEADLAHYIEARDQLGALLITVAPEIVPPAQIAALTEAGIRVALGHTACDYDTACAAFDAGAVMATHLYNAMSGLHHRQPGLVGATLDRRAPFGLIADGVHVHPAALRVALRSSPRSAILISDAMALAGSRSDRFRLGARTVYRRDDRLELEDGTLAGADLTLAQAVQNLQRWTLEDMVAVASAAFDAPWRLLHNAPRTLMKGSPARLLIWRDGQAEARIDGEDIKPLA